MRGRPVALAAAGLCLAAATVSGQTSATDDDEPALAFRYAFKTSALLSRLPEDEALFPDRDSATGFWRFRIEPTVRLREGVTIELAVEQRLRVFSSAAAVSGAGVLPAEAPGPFRLTQLDWRLASSPHAEWRAEIDRAAIHLHYTRADLTVGRQAIGWGRGVLFGAVDLFAPFTPLEADREWRRGVDAVRADVKLTDRTSLDTVAAFADALDRSAFATRLRGYAGKADVEILGGYRAGDRFVGATSSGAIGDFELHGEAALFRTTEPKTVAKAVAGGSYRIPLGNGVAAVAEYHYSGFGAASPDQILALLRDPAFQERYLRGDTQIVTRHAMAVLASYELSPEVTLSGQWLHSPADGSGVVVPSATWTLGDRWSVLASGYLPYGSEPSGTTLLSAFGASPRSAFLQVRTYW